MRKFRRFENFPNYKISEIWEFCKLINCENLIILWIYQKTSYSKFLFSPDDRLNFDRLNFWPPANTFRLYVLDNIWYESWVLSVRTNGSRIDRVYSSQTGCASFAKHLCSFLDEEVHGFPAGHVPSIVEYFEGCTVLDSPGTHGRDLWPTLCRNTWPRLWIETTFFLNLLFYLLFI